MAKLARRWSDSPVADVAAEAMRLVFVDPLQARRMARVARACARAASSTGDHTTNGTRDRTATGAGDRTGSRAGSRAREAAAAESTAERALGLAARELGRLDTAVGHLRRAVRVAEQAGLPVPAAEAQMSLALARAAQGHTADALRLGAAAGRVLRGLEGARLRMQLALIAQRLGRFDEALDGYRRALTVFRREGDLLWEAKLLSNRGVLEAYRGRPRRAEADLERSEELYVRLGQDLGAADVRWNRGFAAGRAGAVAAALRHLAAAERYFAEHRVPRAALLLDKCDILLSAGLPGEAYEAAGQAVRELRRGGSAVDLAEARLMMAHAAYETEDFAQARSSAGLAARAFDRQGRAGWAAVARYLVVAATWSGGRHDASVLRAAVTAADDLAAAGWAVPALDARLIAARIALHRGRTDVAVRQMRAAAGARRSAHFAQRIRAWHATALLRLAAGDRRGARSALRAGARALDAHRATLGATELRVRASQHGESLWQTGLAVAVEGGRADEVLAWGERCRARSLLLRPARPPADEALADALAELRAVVADREQAVAGGRQATALARREAALERTIREHTRQTAPTAQALAAQAPPSPAALGALLGGRVLVSFVEVDGTFVAVTVDAGHTRLHRLGAVTAVTAELRAMRFGLRRVAAATTPAGPGGGGASRAAAAESVRRSAAALDELLIRPLLGTIGDRELVLVPTGALYGLPWSLLPSCAGRPVAVTPSALLWHRAATAGGTGRRRVALVAGPGLPGADAEVRALTGQYPGAVCLTPPGSRVADVLAAIDGARCAHIAAHGRFRGDNAQFSALTFADGPLTVYDLEGLGAPPDLVVLSACDSGLSSVHVGGELIGLAAALLALGTRTLIATLTPVLDASAREFVLDVHARLGKGATPSVALAEAQAAAEPGDPTAAAFLCLGAA